MNEQLITKLDQIINDFYPYQIQTLPDDEYRFNVEGVNTTTHFGSETDDGYTRVEYRIYDSLNDSITTFYAILHWKSIDEFKSNFIDDLIVENFSKGICGGFFNLVNI